jgi:outer membrane protein TolC
MKVCSTRSVVFVLALLPAIAGAQQDAARPISLDEAIKLAQLNAPLTVQARNALRSTDASVKSAISQYIPSLSLTGSAARAGGTTFFQGTRSVVVRQRLLGQSAAIRRRTALVQLQSGRSQR